MSSPGQVSTEALRLSRSGVVVLFLLCSLADGFAIRRMWIRDEIAFGQIRTGYFEAFGTEVGLAMDPQSHSGMLPTLMITSAGELAIPPGLIAVIPLNERNEFAARGGLPLAPYTVIGVDFPLDPQAPVVDNRAWGAARLSAARTLGIERGQLALVPWDAAVPWKTDHARLAALYQACALPNQSLGLTLTMKARSLTIVLGRCSLTERLPTEASQSLSFAMIAGPDWLTLARAPGWRSQRSIDWTFPALIFVKIAAMWWILGGIATVAISLLHLGTSLYAPLPATATWMVISLTVVLLMLIRIAVVMLRRRSLRTRTLIAAGIVLLGAVAFLWTVSNPERGRSIVPTADKAPVACAVLGYSTVEGDGLRGRRGGIRVMLNEDCAPCRGSTEALYKGGETFAWLRDRFCARGYSVAGDGNVTFLGGANDDFFWGGGLSTAYLFVGDQITAEAWRMNSMKAAAMSLARFDRQSEALRGLISCVAARHADFLFLHDFLVTDMLSGRDASRAVMLDKRRDIVTAAGGTFVDMFDRFKDEAGVSWFNDYVHLSLIGHRRVSEVACAQLQALSVRHSSTK